MKGISRTSAPSLRNSWESDPAWCRALPTRIRTPLSAKVVGDSCLFLILARAGLFDFAQRKVRPQRFSRLWRGRRISILNAHEDTSYPLTLQKLLDLPLQFFLTLAAVLHLVF